MELFETVFATIQCNTTKPSLDAIVTTFGLHTVDGEAPNEFHLVTSTRGTEPEVNSDLVRLALVSLQHAQKAGLIPALTVFEAKL